MPLVIPYPKSSEKEKIPGVYAIEHIPTGKRYIGGTGDLGSRGITNRSSLRLGKHKNKPLQDAYNENPNIELKVLYLCETKDEAFDKEQEYINKGIADGSIFNIGLDSRASARGRPVSEERIKRLTEYARNRVDSPETTLRKSLSQRGKVLSEEHKAKISLGVNKPEIIAKIKLANTGRKHTDEFKQKLKIIMTGKKHTEESKKLMSEKAHTPAKPVVINGVNYPSIKAASRELKINNGGLSAKLKNGKDPNFKYL